ncbi:MAG: exopolyphosphatase [Bradyrhizobiaceae bacterium]|nr:MAG: exopolyphosphatase [Bradyrhizobiaceae bacterium]
MESRLKNLRRAVLRAVQSVSAVEPAAQAAAESLRPRVIKPRKPAKTVAVIDIGSNSVRLVVYEGLTRSLAPIFNEKVLCGLGREVQSTGLLGEKEVETALGALRRFRALIRVMKVGHVYAIATAACRDAKNGPEFIAKAQRLTGCKIEILSGAREAKLSALGVISGVHKPDGIVGDLGGGSLELIDVHGHRVRAGVTLPLGGLALQDASQKSLKKAERIVKDEISAVSTQLKGGAGRTFYAVGGTWRAFARIHIIQSGYPLRVMHGYSIPAADALDFARRVRRLVATNSLADIETVTEARRPLLGYAALVMENIITTAKPTEVVFSTYGVREGLLFEMLPEREQIQDGLLANARTLNNLRSRAPRHAEDLVEWTDRFMKAARLRETEEDRRLRHAACLLSDIGWRAHPDYRGEQTLHIITNGNFGAISHEGRVFLSLASYYRYAGISNKNEPVTELRQLLSPAMVERARLLGAAFRVAFLISAAHPGVLSMTHFRNYGDKLILIFDPRIEALVSDRIASRFRQLARLIKRAGVIQAG